MAKIDQVLNKLAVMDERDRNTSKDIEAIHETLKVVVERSQKHEQTLYGENGENGLKGEIKNIRSRVRVMERVFYGAQAVVGTLAVFKDQILSFFGSKQ